MPSGKIAWIGNSMMSAPLCAHLAAIGIKPIVYGIPESVSAQFRKLGVQSAASISEAVKNASVVFLMGFDYSLPFIEHVGGNSVIVDLWPNTPGQALSLSQQAAGHGVYYLDAATLGGADSARKAQLNIFVGGQSAAYAKIRPLLRLFSHDLHYMGGSGSGVHGKLARQLQIAVAIAGLTHSMQYSKSAGIPFENLVKTIPDVPLLGSVSLKDLSERIARGSFSAEEVGTLEVFYQDLCVAMEIIQPSNSSLPGFQQTLTFFENAVNRGYAHLGPHSAAKDYV